MRDVVVGNAGAVPGNSILTTSGRVASPMGGAGTFVPDGGERPSGQKLRGDSGEC